MNVVYYIAPLGSFTSANDIANWLSTLDSQLSTLHLPSEFVGLLFVLAAIDVAKSLPWCVAAVRDIRGLGVEELNDLMPAVQQGDSS